jgi:hypothetical protein
VASQAFRGRLPQRTEDGGRLAALQHDDALAPPSAIFGVGTALPGAGYFGGSPGGLGEGFARGVAAGAKALQPCRGRDLPAQTGTTSSREGSGPLLPADGYLTPPGPPATLAEGASAAPTPRTRRLMSAPLVGEVIGI